MNLNFEDSIFHPLKFFLRTYFRVKTTPIKKHLFWDLHRPRLWYVFIIFNEITHSNMAGQVIKLPLQILQSIPHLCTAVAWREKKSKHFVFYKYFCLVLELLKSRISKKINQPLLRKLDFKLFHYKARVQPVSKITTIATRNGCWM